MLEQLKKLYSDTFGVFPRVEPLPASGGDRRYYRMTPDLVMSGEGVAFDGAGGEVPGSVIGCVADSGPEARAFVRLAEAFSANGVSVPRIYAHSHDSMLYLQQDLGDTSLFSLLGAENIGAMVAASMRELVKMQTVPAGEWEDAVAYKPFSRRMVMWDLNYFKYEYLKNAGIGFDEEALEDDFDRLAGDLMAIPGEMWGFMMRDCQSRNIMMPDEHPVFIDFQGGRMGPCLYDAVSLLWQAKARFTAEFRDEMLKVYAGEFASARNVTQKSVLSHTGVTALFRTLQVLGAYGYRGLVQKRAHFIESIPGALDNLSALLAAGSLASYPELERVCLGLVSDGRFAARPGDGRLHVKIFSFSYKKGYPEDLTGNGGGFMFDCRGMHNPGRYDAYKPLTGLDAPVVQFLKERGEADQFVERAVEMVSPTVGRYIDRRFSSLQIGFGCTGGRHRSVYSAESCARLLAGRFPEAVIEVCHRERGMSKILNE